MIELNNFSNSDSAYDIKIPDKFYENMYLVSCITLRSFEDKVNNFCSAQTYAVSEQDTLIWIVQ